MKTSIITIIIDERGNVFFSLKTSIIIIIDERGGEAFSYWKLASILLLLLVNVEAQCFLTENQTLIIIIERDNAACSY